MPKKNTSWGNVAPWYHNLLKSGQGTFQHDVILPNILRLLDAKSGQTILDLACGPGFFSREFKKSCTKVIGIDIASELIAFAKTATAEAGSRNGGKVPGVEFYTASADKIPMVKNKSVDAVTIILSLQNIENMAGVMSECARVLKPQGRLLLVLNHPAFRVPKESAWDWDEAKHIQYRRVDKYLSEARVKIDMHPGLSSEALAKEDKPGSQPQIFTWSFHRPLQVYVKTLAKAGFVVTKLEEWISNRPGPKGKTFGALEQARKEIPLFLFLEARLHPDLSRDYAG